MDISARTRDSGEAWPYSKLFIDRMTPGIENTNSIPGQKDAKTLLRAGRARAPRAEAHHRNDKQHFISMRCSSSLR